MRACIQRTLQASVRLLDEENREVSRIGRGLLVLLGVGLEDKEEDARRLAHKIAKLRIFDDDEGKMNLDVSAVEGEILVVSQFTLYANSVRGNRPSFTEAAPPEKANVLYQILVRELTNLGISVKEGVFRANMGVELINDGPVTIWLDTLDLVKGKRTSA